MCVCCVCWIHGAMLYNRTQQCKIFEQSKQMRPLSFSLSFIRCISVGLCEHLSWDMLSRACCSCPLLLVHISPLFFSIPFHLTPLIKWSTFIYLVLIRQKIVVFYCPLCAGMDHVWILYRLYSALHAENERIHRFHCNGRAGSIQK